MTTAMDTAAKPRPVADPDSKPYWDGCAEHKLLIQACADCGRHRFPPGPVCQDCGSRKLDWIEASGRGRVFSWIVVHHPVPREVYAGEVPYVVAIVELAEGVRMASNVVDCAPDAVTADMAVEVTFRDNGSGVILPLFRPVPR